MAPTRKQVISDEAETRGFYKSLGLSPLTIEDSINAGRNKSFVATKSRTELKKKPPSLKGQRLK